jgi:hypothetical protein
MSALIPYIEQLEQSIERHQASLENDIGEFEDLCNRGVELGNATVLHQADQSFKRALARFHEIDQAKLALSGPTYHGLVRQVPQRETILAAIRARYYQAHGRVEQWRRKHRWKTPPEPAHRKLAQVTGVRDTEPVMDRGIVTSAWNGDTHLWKAFWLYSLMGLNSGVLIAGYVFGLVGIPYFAVWIAIAPVAVWAAVSVWRCAFNSRWQGWGYLARAVLIVQLLGIGAGLVVK